MQRPILIFDFDGTLADSLDVVIAAYNRVAPRLSVRLLEQAALPRLRTLAPQQALREYGIRWWKLPLLVHGVRAELRREHAAPPAIAGIVPALEALSAAGCHCLILSTNARDNIERFLTLHRLSMFAGVVGGASLYGKARALRRLLKRRMLDPSHVHYVGDEVRDVGAALEAGVKSVAVSWGYADRGALAAAAPDRLIDHPDELVALFAAGAKARLTS